MNKWHSEMRSESHRLKKNQYPVSNRWDWFSCLFIIQILNARLQFIIGKEFSRRHKCLCYSNVLFLSTEYFMFLSKYLNFRFLFKKQIQTAVLITWGHYKNGSANWSVYIRIVTWKEIYRWVNDTRFWITITRRLNVTFLVFKWDSANVALFLLQEIRNLNNLTLHL